MTKIRKVKCKECDERRPIDDVFTARHHGGGTYRRPGRMYDSTICIECAQRALASTSEGYYLCGAAHWDVGGLERALKRHLEYLTRPKGVR